MYEAYSAETDFNLEKYLTGGVLGISFILLTGGEPLIRRDIMEAAGKIPEILFPVFTNGLLIDDGYIELFNCSRFLELP